MSFATARRSPQKGGASGATEEKHPHFSDESFSASRAEQGGDVIPLSRQSEEYSRILYLLELCLRSTDITEMKAWKVSNPQLSMQFERKTKNMMCLESWVDAAKLSKTNHVQEVCSRGFHTPETGKGLTFRTGKIRIDHPPAENGQYQFVLCKVGVGKSFVLDDPEESQELPEGYDSYYVHRPEENTRTDDYQHEYIIPDSTQVLPQYIVHFKYSPKHTTPPSSDASSRRQRFRVDINAVRQKVREALSVLGPEAEDQTEQMLQQMTDKYETALNASQQNDPLLEERKRGIEDTIQAITEKVSEIQQNHQAVEDEIYRRMQEVLHQLNANTEKKIAVLLGEELELRRQKQQIEWTEDFVPILREALPPMDFIKAWDKHQAMRSALYSQAGGRVGLKQSRAVLDDVRGDLQLVGHLEVIPESDARHYMETEPSSGSNTQPQATRGATLMPYSFNDSYPHYSGGSANNEGPTVQETWRQFLQEEGGAVPEAPPASRSELNRSPVLRTPYAQDKKNTAGESPHTPAPTASAQPQPQTIEEADRLVQQARNELYSAENYVRNLPVSQQSYGEQILQEHRDKVDQAEKQRAELVQNQAYSRLRMSPTGASNYPKRNGHSSVQQHSSIEQHREPSSSIDSHSSTKKPNSSGNSPRPQRPTQNKAPSTRKQMPVESLLERYDLRNVAQTRSRGLGDAVNSIPTDFVFPDSRIITDGDIGMTLYLNLPFLRPSEEEAQESPLLFPVTSLLYSSFNQYPHVESVEEALRNYEADRGQPPSSTLVLISSGDRQFGGYASEPWRFDGMYHGNPSSFLFMLSPHLAKIPFHGRVTGPAQETDEELREEHERMQDEMEENYYEQMQALREDLEEQGVVFDNNGNVVDNPNDADTSLLDQPPPRRKPWIRHDAQRSATDFLEFGLGDLVLMDDLTDCSSELENSYGIGMKRGSDECRKLLSGSESGRFKIDILEVWAIEYDYAE
eukprot:gb/GECG01011455.1/.p1 GENE.gb/GECG01011455.1/~~gb/GECG01011455.1/.p1  ORF type:complete len:970 (+),score=148.53 gb/GECG01011455.1/:1-2910(+)